ncbi:MAG: hypothetical protein ACI8Z1_003115 [Candidatus Azotimanducaceae bacterium]
MIYSHQLGRLIVGGLLCIALEGPLNAATSQPLDEPIDPEKIVVIRQLMEVTGAKANHAALTRTFSQQMISVLQAGNTDIDPAAVEIIQTEVEAMLNEQLRDEKLQQRMYQLYARYFTLEELQGLVAFNTSKIGRRANRIMPVLLRESMSAAQAWSEDIAPEMSSRVKRQLENAGYSVGK